MNSIKQTPKNKDCIKRISIPVTSHGEMTDFEYTLVSILFIKNGIAFDNFRFTRTYKTSVNAYNGAYDSRNVYGVQYTNSLPIFIESLNYHFKNDVFDGYSGRLTNGTGLDNAPSSALAQLRKLFINDIGQFDHKANQYEDKCFTAELGYYNVNTGTGNTNENLVKAWRITPENSSYPEGYYQDKSGKRINYFNGIFSFK